MHRPSFIHRLRRPITVLLLVLVLVLAVVRTANAIRAAQGSSSVPVVAIGGERASGR